MSYPKRGDSKAIAARHERFVERYLLHGDSARASQESGFAGTKVSGKHLLKRADIRKVMSEATSRSKVIQTYNAEQAMLEAEEAMQFARETENANAFVKAIELRSKLKGLLIEKHQVQQVGFQINIGGIEDAPMFPTRDVPALAPAEPSFEDAIGIGNEENGD